MSRSGILEWYGSFILTFQETSTVEVFHSGYTNLLFHQQHTNIPFSPHPQVWGDISLWCWFAFIWWLVMLSIFSCVVGYLYVFFGKISTQILCPILNLIVLFWFLFCYWLVWVPHILRMLTPYQIYGFQIFFMESLLGGYFSLSNPSIVKLSSKKIRFNFLSLFLETIHTM